MAITPPKITKTITATNPSSTESSNDQVKKILDGLEEAKKIKETHTGHLWLIFNIKV